MRHLPVVLLFVGLVDAVAQLDHGSRRVLEKCGFTVIAEVRGFANARGEEIDELVLRLDGVRREQDGAK